MPDEFANPVPQSQVVFTPLGRVSEVRRLRPKLMWSLSLLGDDYGLATQALKLLLLVREQ